MSQEVELWLKPINNGKNTFPMVCVGDKVYAYGEKGYSSYPKKSVKKPSKWENLGKCVLSTSTKVSEKVVEIYLRNFTKYDAKTANPVKFSYCLCEALLETIKDPKVWRDLLKQDWTGIAVDIGKIMSSSSGSSSFSSFR